MKIGDWAAGLMVGDQNTSIFYMIYDLAYLGRNNSVALLFVLLHLARRWNISTTKPNQANFFFATRNLTPSNTEN